MVVVVVFVSHGDSMTTPIICTPKPFGFPSNLIGPSVLLCRLVDPATTPARLCVVFVMLTSARTTPASCSSPMSSAGNGSTSTP